MDRFAAIWDATNEHIERSLWDRGETFLLGNPTFDAMSAMISENRARREAYERAVSTPIRDWRRSPLE